MLTASLLTAPSLPPPADAVSIPPPRPKRKPLRPYPRKDAPQSQYSGGVATYGSSERLGGGSSIAAPSGTFRSISCSESDDVNEATVAAVAAAASAAAAAAAAAVVAAAGQQVQAHLQAHPPNWFPFFGMPPSLLQQQMTMPHGSSLEVRFATCITKPLPVHRRATCCCMPSIPIMQGYAPCRLLCGVATPWPFPNPPLLARCTRT